MDECDGMRSNAIVKDGHEARKRRKAETVVRGGGGGGGGGGGTIDDTDNLSSLASQTTLRPESQGRRPNLHAKRANSEGQVRMIQNGPRLRAKMLGGAILQTAH